MASIVIMLLTIKKQTDNKHPVVLRVTIDLKRTYITIGENSDYSCTQSQWDFDKNRYNKNFPDFKLKNQILSNKETEAKNILTKAEFGGVPFTITYFKNA